MTRQSELLGIPITGDYNSGQELADQYPLSDFQLVFGGLMNDPAIEEVGWHQYTPYFNDGDPCYFGIHGGPWVKPFGRKFEDEYEEDDYKYDGCWNDSRPHVKAFYEALHSGHFDHVLIELFGDHAFITVTRKEITVEYYEHD